MMLLPRLRLSSWLWAWAAGFWLAGAPGGLAGLIRFQSVEATSFKGSKADLRRVIDGLDANSSGWSIGPLRDHAQSLVLVAGHPFQAGRLRIAISFLSRVPNAHFHDFTVSRTSDSNPGLESSWEPLVPVSAYSTGTRLTTLKGGQLHSSGPAWNTVFVVEARVPSQPLTALRIDVLAAPSEAFPKDAYVGSDANGDFVLTEVRAVSFDAEATNVAIGCPVKASHEPWPAFLPEFLTDGAAATFTHPRDPALGNQFYYEIDFGQERELDHISLVNRGDGQVPNRLSQVRLVLSNHADGEVGPSVEGDGIQWQALHRGDGSYPSAGGVDVIRARQGSGVFRGRYLRISSESPIAYSPQLAEVEAYEPLKPVLAGLRADQLTMDLNRPVSLPADTRWLAFQLRYPTTLAGAPLQLPPGLLLRWRLPGYLDEWQEMRREGVAEGLCPPPGRYRFEAQMAHSDGQWNDAMLVLPITVLLPVWREPFVLAVLAGGLGLAAAWLIRQWSRRRLARRIADLERHKALNDERARIARDMHDVVGARLTQWTVLHDILAAEHRLPEAALASFKRLTGTAREAIAALDEVVWAINPRNDTLANVADYLCHCATEYFGPLEIRCRQDVPAEWEPLQVRAQTRHELLLAFKEALQNVVKHAAATEVTVIIRQEALELLVRLEDNGRGLAEDLGGLEKDGLRNMRARLESVGGSCRIFPRSTGGTAVEMRVAL